MAWVRLRGRHYGQEVHEPRVQYPAYRAELVDQRNRLWQPTEGLAPLFQGLTGPVEPSERPNGQVRVENALVLTRYLHAVTAKVLGFTALRVRVAHDWLFLANRTLLAHDANTSSASQSNKHTTGCRGNKVDCWSERQLGSAGKSICWRVAPRNATLGVEELRRAANQRQAANVKADGFAVAECAAGRFKKHKRQLHRQDAETLSHKLLR